MALVIETKLVCDRCGRSFEGDSKLPGSSLRIDAAKEGWIRGGKETSGRRNGDSCPECIMKRGRRNITKMV